MTDAPPPPERDGRDRPAPPAAPGPAPRAVAARRPLHTQLLALLVGDPWLKLLALALACVSWYVVRNQLETDSLPYAVTLDVVDVPPSIRLRGGTTRSTRLGFAGTKGSVDRAIEALDRAGRRVPTRFPVGEREGRRASAQLDHLVLPPECIGLVKRMEPVTLEWDEIATAELDVADPVSEDPSTVVVPVEVKPRRVRVTGPKDVVAALVTAGERVSPDALPAAEVRRAAELQTEYRFAVGFAQWRRRAPDRAEPSLAIEPATVSGTVRLASTTKEAVVVEPSLLYPPGGELDAWRAFEVTIVDSKYDPRTRRLTVEMTGEASVLEDIRSGHSPWLVALELPPPPATPDGRMESVPAPVRLVPVLPGAPLRPPTIHPPTIYVTISPRK